MSVRSALGRCVSVVMRAWVRECVAGRQDLAQPKDRMRFVELQLVRLPFGRLDNRPDCAGSVVDSG
jgi:hypothetical protein